MSDKIPMTPQGKKALEEELSDLKKNQRPTVIQEIAEARSHGDLSENAEYDAAKEKQSFIEGRILEVDDKLARSEVIDPLEVKTDKVIFGATVTLEDCDTEEIKTYQIVGTDEADIKNKTISIESPIARQLLQKKEGDVVTIKIPKGEVEYEVKKIEYK